MRSVVLKVRPRRCHSRRRLVPALVGIIERLADLAIVGGFLTMDQFLIFLPAALAGWVAMRPRVIAGERRTLDTTTAVAEGWWREWVRPSWWPAGTSS